jgi:hypothetical protein
MANKQPLYFPKREDKKVVALGLSQVIVGKNKVEAQEIFNIKKQKHSC